MCSIELAVCCVVLVCLCGGRLNKWNGFCLSVCVLVFRSSLLHVLQCSRSVVVQTQLQMYQLQSRGQLLADVGSSYKLKQWLASHSRAEHTKVSISQHPASPAQVSISNPSSPPSRAAARPSPAFSGFRLFRLSVLPSVSACVCDLLFCADNVTMHLNAVIYIKIDDPYKASYVTIALCCGNPFTP